LSAAHAELSRQGRALAACTRLALRFSLKNPTVADECRMSCAL